MSEADITSFPVRLLPSRGVFDNYIIAYTRQPILHYMKNSFIITLIAVFLNISISVMSAYALVRTDIKYKKLFMSFILAITLLPIITILQPIYEMFSKMGLLNTYLGVAILEAVMGLPMSTWFMTALIKQIPIDFEESARIEGANIFQLLIHIYFPLLKAGIGSLSILKFIGTWNAFLLPQILNMAKSHRTLTVGITMYQSDHEIPFGVISAAAMTTIIPVIIIILIFQRSIINNVLKGGVKG
jgi:multiple sugar transport system permease protein